MNRPWRVGLGARLGLSLVFVCFAGLGALFGVRAHAIRKATAQVWALREEHAALKAEIQRLRIELGNTEKPEVVARMAREVLRWGYPDEELVIIIRRR